MERCRQALEGGPAFTMGDDWRAWAALQHAGRTAWEAVELLFRNAGSSAARDGSRLQRYLRDAAMYRTHISSQIDQVAPMLAALHLPPA
jgi:3-hydroxy-9,10-secoandrosta-1,3,5(10)-triene-9,17-dione monooxygenase